MTCGNLIQKNLTCDNFMRMLLVVMTPHLFYFFLLYSININIDIDIDLQEFNFVKKLTVKRTKN